jgi:predicted N-acetyltransferase YhbS
MKKNDSGTAALNFVEDFGVVRAQAVHVKKLEHRHDFVAGQLQYRGDLGFRDSQQCALLNRLVFDIQRSLYKDCSKP